MVGGRASKQDVELSLTKGPSHLRAHHWPSMAIQAVQVAGPEGALPTWSVASQEDPFQ